MNTVTIKVNGWVLTAPLEHVTSNVDYGLNMLIQILENSDEGLVKMLTLPDGYELTEEGEISVTVSKQYLENLEAHATRNPEPPEDEEEGEFLEEPAEGELYSVYRNNCSYVVKADNASEAVHAVTRYREDSGFESIHYMSWNVDPFELNEFGLSCV